jgi:hypothetical protein
MKIKIKDKIYNAEKEHIMLIFINDIERKNIGDILINNFGKDKPNEVRRVLFSPEGTTQKEMKRIIGKKDKWENIK